MKATKRLLTVIDKKSFNSVIKRSNSLADLETDNTKEVDRLDEIFDALLISKKIPSPRLILAHKPSLS